MVRTIDSNVARKLRLICKLGLIAMLLFLESLCGTTLLTGATSFYVNTFGSEEILHGMIAASILVPLVAFIMHSLLKLTQKYTYIAAIYYAFYVMLIFLAIFLYTKQKTEVSATILFINAYSGASILTTISWILVQRLFNPIEFRQYSPLFFIVDCCGIIGSGVFSKLYSEFIDILFITKFCLSAAVGIFIVLFFIHYTFKIQYIQERSTNTGNIRQILHHTLTHKLLLCILSLAAIQALLEPCLFYEFTFMLGQQFQDEKQISHLMATYVLSSSALLLLFRLVITFLVKIRLRLHYYLVILGSIMLVVFIALSTALKWEILLIAVIIRYGTEHSFYIFGYEHLVNGLTLSQKTNMKLLVEGVFIPIYTILITITLNLFTTAESFKTLNFILLMLEIIFIYTAFKLRTLYKRHHMLNLSLNDEEAKAQSIQSLGLERIKEAVPPMVQILAERSDFTASSPYKDITIDYNIILALGEIAAPGSERAIYKAFQIQNSQIQIAAITTLSRFKSFFVEKFLVDVLLKRDIKLCTLEVRLTLIQEIYRRIGGGVVVILMPFLRDKDARIVANTIEAFSVVSDERIIEIIKPYINDVNNRVKSNAIIALYKFTRCRAECVQAVSKMIVSNKTLAIDSASYVIGRLKLYQFTETLLSLKISRESTRRNVAFALSSLGINEGYKMFAEILTSPDENLAKQILHNYYQLDLGSKMKIMESALLTGACLTILFNLFKNSPVDVSGELLFLEFEEGLKVK